MIRTIKVEGRIYRGNRIHQLVTAQGSTEEDTFAPLLERCLIDICHQLDVPIPLWMERNTHEFARYHQTMFTAVQFMDPIRFDRFQIRLLEDVTRR